MEVNTTRFGRLEVRADDVLCFPAGLPGLEQCTSWVLLGDAHNDALGWLQCTERPDVALAVVAPGRFVPGYQLRVGRNELGPTLCDCREELHVLVIVGKNERGITLNLRAPLVIDMVARVGRQVVANGDLSVQHELAEPETALRRAA